MGQLLPASRLVDKLDFFALGKACQKGNADIVRYLISQRKVDPSKAATRTGPTCLRMTSLGMPLEVVDMLLDAIDVDAVTESQETPLMLALRRGRVDFARHFRFRGAAIDARDAIGNTSLHHAIQSGSVRALEWCIEEEHMDVNCKSRGGSTPLHLAVLRDDGRLVKYLLDQDANVFAADNQGNTPFHLATAQRTGVSVLNMLSAKAGPEVWNVKNEICSSPLDLARESGLLDKLRKECPAREPGLLD